MKLSYKLLSVVLLVLIVVTIVAVSVKQPTQPKVQTTDSSVPNSVGGTPSLLTTHLEMGPTALLVKDLETQQNFYTTLVGLQVLEAAPGMVALGWSGRAVLRLYESATLPKFDVTDAGLYHNAIVFASRSELSLAVERILQQQPTLYSGTADHLVSEAFYFTDPEGNGLELYFDKDPAGWIWRKGRVQMDSLYIDPQQYITHYSLMSGEPQRKMGHVHLQVGSIGEAKQFYVDVLGLAITSESNSALFVSDGFYHHHLGMNIWQSVGAGPRPESLGLRSFELWVATDEDMNKLRQRLTDAPTAFLEEDEKIIVHDPWSNQVIIRQTPSL